jgi:hypothetical protein
MPLVDLLAAALLIHLEGESENADARLAEMVARQADAVIASADGVDRHIELDAIWKRAKDRAAKSHRHSGAALEQMPDACPVSIGQLLDIGFDPYAVLAGLGRC